MNGLSSQALSRRALLKRGAVVGGATVWVVPLVQTFSMSAAHADTPSGAPTSITPTHPVHPTHPVGPTQIHHTHGTAPSDIHTSSDTQTSHAVDALSSSNAGPGGLANTGPAIPVVDLLGIGAGAVVVGLSVTAASQRRPSPHRSH